MSHAVAGRISPQPTPAGEAEADKRPARRAGIHPTAVVDRTAEVDATATIGPYCVVGPHVTIGAGVVLHSHVSVQERTSVGAGTAVFPFAVLGADPQDLKYRGEDTELIIGERNTIREHATLHRGTGVGGGKTVVGSDCLIMVGAHVAHDCVLEDEVILANAVMLGGHCLIEHGATIAGGAGIHHFATVGRLAFVGGLARISKDVPPFLVVEGNPAEPRKVNTTALVRRLWPVEQVEALRTAYKSLFRGEVPMTAVIERLRSDGAQPEPVLRLCDFLEKMTQGVHGRWRETLREKHAKKTAPQG
ncbi:MAG: acyl-ACP--UDP-N-acetylglucosamine O-acyltransferase [Phycisphaerales bacterium]|nr:acyl-ACP--UDP-N-acetylglucosamine O-acyltransferase [Phycisphaerales bacterium]